MIRALVTSFMMIVASMVAVIPASAGFFGSGRPKLVDHGFGFDAVADSPNIEVLDYVYGTSLAPGASMPQWSKDQGGIAGGTATFGEMVVGETLFVKWRLKQTQEQIRAGAAVEIFDDTVDLKSRLPSNISGHEIYFVVNGKQLEVYLVTSTLRSPADPIVGPTKFRSNIVVKIYPDTP